MLKSGEGERVRVLKRWGGGFKGGGAALTMGGGTASDHVTVKRVGRGAVAVSALGSVAEPFHRTPATLQSSHSISSSDVSDCQVYTDGCPVLFFL